MSTLSELQDWYLAQWNDDDFRSADKHYESKIRIETLDYPLGWRVSISVPASLWEIHDFIPVKYGLPNADWLTQKEEFGDWVQCAMKNGVWHGKCGAQKIDEILNLFLQWAREAFDKREHKERQRSDDVYWKVLGDDVWQRECCVEGCASLCARNVVRCRAHHFEFVKRRPYIYED